MKPKVKWKRSNGRCVTSHCGLFQVIPVYSKKNISYKLYEKVNDKFTCIYTDVSQAKCKDFVK